jgi:hypothetical protein
MLAPKPMQMTLDVGPRFGIAVFAIRCTFCPVQSTSVTDLLPNKHFCHVVAGHQARQKLTPANGDVDIRAFRLLASTFSSGSMKLFTVAGLLNRAACMELCCSRVNAAAVWSCGLGTALRSSCAATLHGVLWCFLTFCVSADDELDQHCQHDSVFTLFPGLMHACNDETDLLPEWTHGGVWAQIMLSQGTQAAGCRRSWNDNPDGAEPYNSWPAQPGC